jgi:hypothetical protein
MTGVPDVESRRPLVMTAIYPSVSVPIAANEARVSYRALAVRTQVRLPYLLASTGRRSDARSRPIIGHFVNTQP